MVRKGMNTSAPVLIMLAITAIARLDFPCCILYCMFLLCISMWYVVFGTRSVVYCSWYSVIGIGYAAVGIHYVAFTNNAIYYCKSFVKLVMPYSPLCIKQCVPIFGFRYLGLGMPYIVFGIQY